MENNKTSRTIKGLGLCSGGLDSILSGLLLQKQKIEISFICFETPFFSSKSAKKASLQTGIPLITLDITDEYLKMMQTPQNSFGKNMNPCTDCHALMFKIAGRFMQKQKFDFLFSGEVLGQRLKSQTKNALRYVEKKSGFQKLILRPLSAKFLPKTLMEENKIINREKLMDISGRSRKIQIQMAKEFGIKEYPAPAGGCLLTDKAFSNKLKDLFYVQKKFVRDDIELLKYGRHFRLDPKTKIIVGRSYKDNQNVLKYFNEKKDIWLTCVDTPGPDVVIRQGVTKKQNDLIKKAAMLCAAYSKSNNSKRKKIEVTIGKTKEIINADIVKPLEFKDLML